MNAPSAVGQVELGLQLPVEMWNNPVQVSTSQGFAVDCEGGVLHGPID